MTQTASGTAGWQPGVTSRSHQPLRIGLRSIALLAGCVAAFFLFAPRAVGGPTGYVVTDGVSMLPHFRANGLVVTRTEPTYHVGEVVAYHNPQLRSIVMHRIVAVSGGRYVLKGDNNDFDDAYHPMKSQIVGKEWVYIPNAGRVLDILRSPLMFGLVMGLLGIFAARAYVPVKNRRRRRHGRTN